MTICNLSQSTNRQVITGGFVPSVRYKKYLPKTHKSAPALRAAPRPSAPRQRRGLFETWLACFQSLRVSGTAARSRVTRRIYLWALDWAGRSPALISSRWFRRATAALGLVGKDWRGCAAFDRAGARSFFFAFKSFPSLLAHKMLPAWATVPPQARAGAIAGLATRPLSLSLNQGE